MALATAHSGETGAAVACACAVLVSVPVSVPAPLVAVRPLPRSTTAAAVVFAVAGSWFAAVSECRIKISKIGRRCTCWLFGDT